MCNVSNTDLPPDAGGVPYVSPAVGQLPDTVVHGHTAPAIAQVLLCHLHPAQRADRKGLEGAPHTVGGFSCQFHQRSFSSLSYCQDHNTVLSDIICDISQQGDIATIKSNRAGIQVS